MRRVVITGAGTVNPLARSVAGTWQAMAEGRCAIGPLDIPDLDRLTARLGAQIHGWRWEDHFTRPEISYHDRHSQFALVAAREAVAQAGLGPRGHEGAAVIMGTAGGGLTTSDEAFRAVYAEGKNRVHPFTVPRLMHNAAASLIALEHGITGPVFSVSSACASSNHAIGLAFQMVRSGAVPFALAGGSEAMLTFGGLKAWEGLKVLSPDGCRPFSADRNGMVQGEGAAVFVLEDGAAAEARGARILAEVAGFAMTCDARDMVQPDPAGAARAMRGAMADGGIAPEEVGYINAHGTGTVLNDRTEAAAIAAVFGDRAGQIPVSSSKAMHGHLIGATGAVELLASLLALNEGIIPPTINYRQPDPACPLDVVPNVARRAEVQVTLSNAFAFGGLNAVLALRRA